MPTLPLTAPQIAIAIAMATLGALLQGSIGFGLAVVAAPILLLLNEAFVPGPTLFAAMLLVVLMALRERRSVIVGDIGLAVFGRFVGMLPAVYAISILPKAVYELLFSVLVLLMVLLSATGQHLPPNRINVFIAGILSGFVGTISSVGGPVMALVYQNESGPSIRATLGAIFTLGSLVSLIGLWWVGRFGAIELALGLLLLPGVLIGFALSRYTKGYIDRAGTRPVVLLVAALSAVAVMLRALSAHF